MRGKKKGPPDPYKGLSNEWRAGFESAKDEEILKAIQDTAMANSALMDTESEDQDLKAARATATAAAEQYTKGKKENKLKIKFLRKTLESRGRDVPVSSDFARQDPSAE
jgi:hypothetical protein